MFGTQKNRIFKSKYDLPLICPFYDVNLEPAYTACLQLARENKQYI